MPFVWKDTNTRTVRKSRMSRNVSKYYLSMVDASITLAKDMFLENVSITRKYCKEKYHSCLCYADPTGREKRQKVNPSNLDSAVGNSMLIETGNSVALQKAQAQVAGKCRS